MSNGCGMLSGVMVTLMRYWCAALAQIVWSHDGRRSFGPTSRDVRAGKVARHQQHACNTDVRLNNAAGFSGLSIAVLMQRSFACCRTGDVGTAQGCRPLEPISSKTTADWAARHQHQACKGQRSNNWCSLNPKAPGCICLHASAVMC